MFARMVIAVVGAVVVTTCLLLIMDSATSAFRDRNLERFFRITDILPRPDPGRPVRPEGLGRQPAVPRPDSGASDVRIDIEAPVAPAAPDPGLRRDAASDPAGSPATDSPSPTDARPAGAGAPADE